MEITRILPVWALKDLPSLNQPMVWLTGPRQVGKTYLTKKLDAGYFNWDTPEVRKAYIKNPYFFRSGHQLIIFDEIHKRRDWKRILKGYYDSPSRRENFIVTGSGRMDQYVRGGDSLQGRYNLVHLWPISYDEWILPNEKVKPSAPRSFGAWEPDSSAEIDTSLLKFGGFPMPLIEQSENKLRRWEDQYLDRLVREDSRDFSAVQRLDHLDLLARILPERVGSPLSVKAISEDVEASTVAIKSWLRLFETLYLGFFVSPFHRKIHRAVKKEKKFYFYQWTYCKDTGAKFENYMAVQLANACSAWSEQGYGRWELFYLRDQDRREIDFLITNDLKPMALVEAKSQFQSWPSSLHYYTHKLNIPGFLVYPSTHPKKDRIEKVDGKGWCIPSANFLKGLMVYAN